MYSKLSFFGPCITSTRFLTTVGLGNSSLQKYSPSVTLRQVSLLKPL